MSKELPLLNYIELKTKWDKSLMQFFANVFKAFEVDGDLVPCWMVMNPAGELEILTSDMPPESSERDVISVKLKQHMKKNNTVAYCSALEIWHIGKIWG